MSGPFRYGRLPLVSVEWLASRSVLYLAAILAAAQSFAGVAGIGKGGEWILGSLLFEIIGAFWLATAFGWFSRGETVPVTATEEPGGIRVRATEIELSVTTATMLDIFDSGGAFVKRLRDGVAGREPCIVRHGDSGEVLGVLMSVSEFELLHSAATLPLEPQCLEQMTGGAAVEEIPADKVFGPGWR